MEHLAAPWTRSGGPAAHTWRTPTSYEAKLDALLFESYPDAQLPWQGTGTKRAAPPDASEDGDDDGDDGVRVRRSLFCPGAERWRQALAVFVVSQLDRSHECT